MKKEYTREKPNSYTQGKNWESYSWIDRKSTLVFHEIKELIKNSRDLDFVELVAGIQQYYKNKKVKSDCNLFKEDDRFEIMKPNKSIFPEIYIQKL